ncbi:Glycerophosphoryl diester phosphodiesterase [Cordyceps fumosorosea ARSEF 2679]|uniref:Glycerophosphoryl diester phosphodiesterase n=1 Tax=Cordyceps fumosorosea (strain ARSEF 2679) TaxID=1081104 RepID=A0A162IGN4_CORFA|nr:Glycerophosphoryl diester phosphodiesterase [Cordyceps fumosorosea ARSEF 2679]OAA56895.1 Glycerophosphoryl diester phosphodiesterase [Cordyceps fumosorosea ARSEF 2679]
MKFGLNYEKRMLPKWSQHYVDYNGLRTQLRAKTEMGESIEELAGEFVAEVARFREFFTEQYGPMEGSGDGAALELQTFGRLNVMAIRRLFGKFARYRAATPECLRHAESAFDAWTEARQDAKPSFDGGPAVSCPAKDEFSRFLEPQSLEAFNAALRDCIGGHANSGIDPGYRQFLGRLLCLAATYLPSDFIDAILKHKPDLGVNSARGESALYLAAQSGSLSATQSVAGYFHRSGASLDPVVARTGWTPLMVACAQGYTDIVEYLLSSGADARKVDVLGWTAREHAAYRGHLTTASLGDFATAGSPDGELAGRIDSTASKISTPLRAGQKAVIVTLGSVQGGHDRKTLELRRHSGDDAGLTSKSLEIVIHRADSGSKIVPLPLWEDYSTAPIVGRLDVDAQAQVTVRLWDDGGTPSTGNRVLESSGTVLLRQDYAKFGAFRESMLRETTVVMLDRETMEFSGTVLLSYVVATPFAGLDGGEMASYRRQPGDPIRLVGHRGLGQNTAGKSNLQIGENTVTSFLSAYRLGAPFVEFDVQLTRDLEAVIYHDFSFSGSGSDVPIHDISLAQYKYAGDIQNPSGSALLLEAGVQRPRASSSGEDSVLKAMQAQERLRYTVDFDGKGFKANIRGHSIQDAYATLEELLARLPEEIGFNIEMKYQRLHESVDAGVASVTIDINTFVDAALDKIRRLAGRRPIILSSFTPEVCVLLRLKQAAYPVLFITNAGKPPTADRELRAASLQAALRFARRWRLSGLVLACDAFLLCPRLVSLVRSEGLVCASYGVGNNEPANAKMQADAGIDILIVDKVKLIADALSRLPPPEKSS